MEEKRKEGNISAPQKILGKLKENRISLHVARIPLKTKTAFIKLAEEEFCGDYGMTIKWLIDDLMSQDIKEIIGGLQNHESRIVKLELGGVEKEELKKKIKLLSGREIGGTEK